MGTWLIKTLGIALLTFFVTYVAFFIYCCAGYAYSKNSEPIPALLYGIPVGAIASLISVVIRYVRKDSN